MNVLFITLEDVEDINDHGIYKDLYREFIKNGHHVFIVSPTERRNREKTRLIECGSCVILKVKIGNIQKTNIIEKGIATLLIENQINNALKKYFKNISIQLVVYATPPITIVRCLKYIKKFFGAKSYLMLKDIFPQNAVDLGMMRLGGILHSFFRFKEKKLYALSDRIGCMSQANVDYIIKHNPQIKPDKVEICPNCIEVRDVSVTAEEHDEIRRNYGLPLDKVIFVYGGNIGKPQGVDFIIKCLLELKDEVAPFFLIVGSGTEYEKLEKFVNDIKPTNVKLMKNIPKDAFDKVLAVSDVGLIFLDFRFTIPNFPSRLLSYMQAGLPIFACTDAVSDIGAVICHGEFGWYCESNDSSKVKSVISSLCSKKNIGAEASKSREYLLTHYQVKEAYNIITNSQKLDDEKI